MSRVLVLFANAFPYGTWEPFLMQELDYYSDFDRVIIFSLSVRPEQFASRRTIDPKFVVRPVPFRSRAYYLANGIRIPFLKAFWRELAELGRARKISSGRLFSLLAFLSRADSEARFIIRALREMDIQASDEVVLYSYRFFYQPYVMSRIQPMFSNVRLVSRAHMSDLYEYVNTRGYLPLRRGSLEVLDQLVLISAHGMEYVKQTIPGYDHKLALYYMGTADMGVAEIANCRSPLRVVSCSNIVPVKRLDILISGLSLVPAWRSVEWTHFGDGPLMEEMRRQADRLPDHVRVDFRGSVPNGDILAEYRDGRFHVLINTSSSEGVPVSIMEALSVGMPTVATRVGGTGEMVKDGVNGVLLGPDPSASEIAEALLSVAELDDAGYERLKAGARSTWEKRFDANRNYPRFVRDILLDGKNY